jgi:hypothetical protein
LWDKGKNEIASSSEVTALSISYFQKNLASLSMDGKMVMLGFLSGSALPQGDLGPILRLASTFFID